MKRCYLITMMPLLITLSLEAAISDYNLIAKNWVSTHVQNPDGSLRLSPPEINILLNLAHLSFRRSASTLVAQETALKATTMSWHLLQNITQTRRNPSKELPYPESLDHYQKVMTDAWQQQQEHRQIGTDYAQFIELVVNQLSLNLALKNAIEDLREQARVILVDKLSDLRTHVEALIDACNKNKDQENDDQLPLKRLAFMDYVWALLPKLALHSFVEADRLSVKASEEGWQILGEIQRLDNHVWQMIETARSAFYAAIYNELYDCIRRHQLAPRATTILAAHENQLVTTNPAQQLPAAVYAPH